MASLQLLQPPFATSSSLPSVPSSTSGFHPISFCFFSNHHPAHASLLIQRRQQGRSRTAGLVFVNEEDAQFGALTSTQLEDDNEEEDEEEYEPTPEDLECVSQVKRVLELLRKNRDMTFGEVKLTIMIEDPRDIERKRLLGLDEENAPSRDDLASALEEVNEGKIPNDRFALRMLAEEMNSWPNLEIEAPKEKRPSRSLYAKATDTGVDPKEAARRLNVDWDSAAEIEEADESEDAEVPPAVVCP